MEYPDDGVQLFPLGWKTNETKSKESYAAVLKSGKALKSLKAPAIRRLKSKREKWETFG